MIIRDDFEQLHANKMEEMDRFLEKFNLPKLSQEEIETMNKPTANTEIETVVKKSLKKQKHRANWLHK